MTSRSPKTGDLKMVKVRRARRGHRQSRSLVFRISRSTTKPISEESGIDCSLTEEQISIAGGQSECSLNIKIPQYVIHGETEKNESGAIEPISSDNIILQCKKQDDENKDFINAKMYIPDADMDNLTLNSHLLNSNTNILSSNTEILNVDSKQVSSGISETKSCDLRRSSRRILFRVQKDCQSGLPIKETSNDDSKFSFISSTTNLQHATLGEKRKRGRKPGVRVSECKKRKFSRRGRPPKSSFPKHMSLVKPVLSELAGGGQNEKLLFVPPPKNSVWTLVPKELFESEFFKSQLLKVQFSNSTESHSPKSCPAPGAISFSSPAITQVTASQTNGKIQFKIPKVSVNNVPAVRQKTSEDKDLKRPTVIYFKTEKKKFDNSQDEPRQISNPQFLLNKEVSRTQNDLLYLLSKYRMLEDIILKNYYELAGGNLNEAENMLSTFLSSSLPISPEEKVPRICDSQASLSNSRSVFDLKSRDKMLHHTVVCDISSFEPAVDDVDTLSRKIIVESLHLLYSEEAVVE